MGYTALLFCPDEKTARTVTQVLGDLEFSVETCAEPFAAVKKLMGEHFDAIVVDCDNEQNATLLFKSARNSTSNQASLAVAVVEGQAGVAKAFRIGANLVLTKPINVEQAKGTLRVARGLLRKGEPGKPATAPAPSGAATPAASAVKPAAPKPVLPARPVAPTAVSAPRPAVPPVAKPVARPATPPAVVASSAPAANDEDLLEINVDDAPAAPPATAHVAAPAFNEFGRSTKLPPPVVPAATAHVKPAAKPVAPATPPSFGSGAASAPAPAREAQTAHVAETTPASTEADTLFEKPAEASHSEHSGPSTTFTFGGANVAPESSGGSKKILLGVAAAVLVAAGLYFGWTQFHSSESAPASSPTSIAPAPVAAVAQPAKPAPVPPKPVTTAPSTSAATPTSQPAAQPAIDSTPATNSVADDNEPAPENDAPASSAKSTKPASGKAAATTSAAAAAKPAAAPLIVKGGAAPTIHAKPTVPDTPAPSVIGMAAPGAGAPPPNLVGTEASGPKPVLQTLNISQGVSQGLLIKKVQPTYPHNALAMHVEGSVELMATISKSGSITTVKVLSGEQLLTRAASDAVKQWKYKPYLLNGEPVEIQTQITVNFKLPH